MSNLSTINLTVALNTVDLQKAATTLNLIADALPSIPSTLTTPTATSETTTPPPAAAIASTPTIATTGVELDSAGLPWDVRIHSTKKTKLAKDQTWKKRRGIDQATVDLVEAELKVAMSIPAPETTTPSPAAAIAPAPAPTPVPTSEATAPPTPVYYVVGGDHFTGDQLKESGWNDDQIANLPIVAMVTFPELMTKITEGMGGNTITDAQVSQAVTNAGLASTPLLAARPELIPQVYAELFG